MLRPGVAALCAATLVSVACGADGAGTPSALDYGSLRGEVRIDGSSTVFPISEAMAEEFSIAAKNVRANVAFSGTGGGFEKFCRGEIQVSDASRPIKQSEKDKCSQEGITDIQEIQVAVDALTVVVNPANTWAQCLTPAQLQLLYKDGGAAKWSDIDPSWPQDKIKFFYPGTDSGTFDYFVEAIITLGGKDKAAKHRGDGTASEDDNVLLTAVEREKNAVAYFGFAYYQEAGKKARAVEVDGGKGCVAPTAETAVSGTYTPLARPLFIYTRDTFLREQPEVLGFIRFYLDYMRELVPQVGYVAVSPETEAAQKAKIAPFLPQQ